MNQPITPRWNLWNLFSYLNSFSVQKLYNFSKNLKKNQAKKLFETIREGENKIREGDFWKREGDLNKNIEW